MQQNQEESNSKANRLVALPSPGEGVSRVWLKIDLGALPRNFLAFTSFAPQT